MFKDLYTDASPMRKDTSKNIEVPYTLLATLLKYRTDKGLDLQSLNPQSKIAENV